MLFVGSFEIGQLLGAIEHLRGLLGQLHEHVEEFRSQYAGGDDAHLIIFLVEPHEPDKWRIC